LIRNEVESLLAFAPLPSSSDTLDDPETVERIQRLIEAVEGPVSDEEAMALLSVFGPDEFFGLAWALVHLIESAPGWPFQDLPNPNQNEWIRLMQERAARGAAT
jgi:hypothetical protein